MGLGGVECFLAYECECVVAIDQFVEMRELLRTERTRG